MSNTYYLTKHSDEIVVLDEDNDYVRFEYDIEDGEMRALDYNQVDVTTLTRLVPVGEKRYETPEVEVHTNDSGTLVIGTVKGDSQSSRTVHALASPEELAAEVQALAKKLAVTRAIQAHLSVERDSLVRRMGNAYLSTVNASPNNIADMKVFDADKFLSGMTAALEVVANGR